MPAQDFPLHLLYKTSHLYPSRVLANAQFLLFSLPSCSQALPCLFRTPECSTHYFRLSPWPHATFWNTLCCSATWRSSHVEGQPVASYTPGDIPVLKAFPSHHPLSGCSSIQMSWASPHVLQAWPLMLFIVDPLSAETSHALGIVTPELKATCRHCGIFCDSSDSTQMRMSNSSIMRKDERT